MIMSIDRLDEDEIVAFTFTFIGQIDSVVYIEVDGSSFAIKILAYGDIEEVLDGGFPLYFKDGSSLLDNDLLSSDEVMSTYLVSKIRSFYYMQTAFIKVCMESHRAVQMLESNPCLLWLMLDFSIKNSLTAKHLHSWLGVKRKRIVREIVGTDVDGAEKFVSKIVPLTGEENELELIRRTVSVAEIVSAFNHWVYVPIQALYISERYPELLGADYLLEWCSKDGGRMSDYLIGSPSLDKLTGDAVRLGEELNIKNSKAIVKACKTVDQLKKLHDNWVISLNRSRRYYDPDIEFNRPKIMECEGVAWISSANGLIDEGKRMKHCVATYIRKVISGESIIFSVIYPERATLEIREKSGKFNMVEIKKENNLEVSRETRLYIENWLNQAK